MRIKQFGISIVATAAASLAFAGASSAATPTGDYAQFNHCPVSTANVTSCLFSQVTSGSFKIGTKTVPINKTITLQGGIGSDPVTFQTFFVPAVGADSLSKTPLDVPGGLLGIMQGSGFTGLLLAAFEAAIHGVNGVTATAEAAGLPTINVLNFALGTGTALILPVRIHLENPFLGSGCYIGSTTTPVNIVLTTGTSTPPAGYTPLVGSPGVTEFLNDGDLVTSTGFKLVGNSFSVPAASNCGFLPLDKLLITAAVNAQEGLPAAAGVSQAIQQGNQKLANRDAVVASS
jgi:hypothetical protein